MDKVLVGVDVGGTTVKLGIFPWEGPCMDVSEIPTPHTGRQEDLWDAVAEGIRARLAFLNIDGHRLAAVGVAVPGPVDADGFVPWLVNIGIGACYPAKEIEERLRVPAVSANDANAAALGEAVYGAGRGHRNIAMLTLGTGVGGGIIIDGKIVAGAHGCGAEIGHFVVNPDEEEACNCGNHGCLEQYASATGMVRSVKRFLRSEDTPSVLRDLQPEEISAREVADAAKAGDAIALKAFDVYGKYLGLGISHLVLTTDPELIIIGGGVSNAGQILIDTVDPYVDRYTHIAKSRADIVLATLGNDAGVSGCAAMAKQLFGVRT